MSEDTTQTVDETTSTEESTEQEQTASEQVSQAEPTEEVAEESTEEAESSEESDEKQIPTQEEKELSPRYQRKATKLAERLTESRQQASEFMRDLYKPAPRPQPYNPMPIEDGQTYSHEDLIRDREMMRQQGFNDGASIAELRMMQFAEMQANERYADQLERESMKVEKKFPELDPENTDTYDAELREEIDSLFAETAYTKRDSYEQFVAKYMKAAEKIADSRSAKTGETIARQASRKPTLGNSTTRDSSKLSREKIASMSDEEYVKRKPEIDKWVAAQNQ